MTIPAFVVTLRNNIPKDGVTFPTDEPKKVSRLKRRIKKALEKQSYVVENVRGVGILVDATYGIEYTTNIADNLITLQAQVVEASELQSKAPEPRTRKRGSRRGTSSRTYPGRHPESKDWSNVRYADSLAQELCELLDVDVASEEKVKAHQWHCWQVSTVRLHGKTPEELAKMISSQVKLHNIPHTEVALLVPRSHREIPSNANVLIGVGPIVGGLGL